MPDGDTSAIMKHCVVDLVDEEGFDTDEAFAVCTETYQDNGYMQDGNHELTQKGESLEREKQNQDGHEDTVERFEEIIGESSNADDDGGLVERASRLVDTPGVLEEMWKPGVETFRDMLRRELDDPGSEPIFDKVDREALEKAWSVLQSKGEPTARELETIEDILAGGARPNNFHLELQPPDGRSHTVDRAKRKRTGKSVTTGY